jgi:hypothetical protein
MKRNVFWGSAGLTFLVFALIGFLLAYRADSLSRLPLARRIALQDRQNNLLLIHVDDLRSQQPVLRSVWVILRYRSESQTALTFLRLFPDADVPQRGQKVSQAFSLTNQGEPAPGFLRKLEEQGVKTSAFFVVDDEGMDQIGVWVQGALGKVNTSDDAEILQWGCAVFSSESKMSLPDFNWLTFAEHLQTNLAFDDLMAEWSSLITSLSPLRCELASQ